MKTLALCIMEKNEATFIEKCIESVKQYVDDIFILDTGSTDNSVELCKKYTNNISRMDFNDNYAEMRNFLLKDVYTDWILYLDADEYFDQVDIIKLKKLIDTAEDDVGGIKFLRYNFFSTGGWYSGKVLKLFRNNISIKYKGNISESVEDSIVEAGLKVIDSDILLNHIGHCRNRDSRDKKAIAYINKFKTRLLQEPDNALMHAFIGLNMRALGDFEEARREAELAVKMNPNSPTMHMMLGHVYRACNMIEHALNEYLIADNLRQDAQTLNMIGVIKLAKGEFDEAANYFNKAMKKQPCAPHIKVNMGLVYFYRGNYNEALNFFEDACNRCSGFCNYNYSGAEECDPFRIFYYETLFSYCGLNRYIESCRYRMDQNV